MTGYHYFYYMYLNSGTYILLILEDMILLEATFIGKVFIISFHFLNKKSLKIRVITKLPNSEQSYKGKVKTHMFINRQKQSTTGKLWES
jgi:hypothetical protein